MTGRLILVNKFFTAGLYDNQEYFGVKKDATSRFELGASVRSFYKFEFVENVFVTNRISLYSDYLENPENIDLDYTINTSLGMPLARYLPARNTKRSSPHAADAHKIAPIIGMYSSITAICNDDIPLYGKFPSSLTTTLSMLSFSWVVSYASVPQIIVGSPPCSNNNDANL